MSLTRESLGESLREGKREKEREFVCMYVFVSLCVKIYQWDRFGS